MEDDKSQPIIVPWEEVVRTQLRLVTKPTEFIWTREKSNVVLRTEELWCVFFTLYAAISKSSWAHFKSNKRAQDYKYLADDLCSRVLQFSSDPQQIRAFLKQKDADPTAAAGRFEAGDDMIYQLLTESRPSTLARSVVLAGYRKNQEKKDAPLLLKDVWALLTSVLHPPAGDLLKHLHEDKALEVVVRMATTVHLNTASCKQEAWWPTSLGAADSNTLVQFIKKHKLFDGVLTLDAMETMVSILGIQACVLRLNLCKPHPGDAKDGILLRLRKVPRNEDQGLFLVGACPRPGYERDWLAQTLPFDAHQPENEGDELAMRIAEQQRAGVQNAKDDFDDGVLFRGSTECEMLQEELLQVRFENLKAGGGEKKRKVFAEPTDSESESEEEGRPKRKYPKKDVPVITPSDSDTEAPMEVQEQLQPMDVQPQDLMQQQQSALGIHLSDLKMDWKLNAARSLHEHLESLRGRKVSPLEFVALEFLVTGYSTRVWAPGDRITYSFCAQELGLAGYKGPPVLNQEPPKDSIGGLFLKAGSDGGALASQRFARAARHIILDDRIDAVERCKAICMLCVRQWGGGGPGFLRHEDRELRQAIWDPTAPKHIRLRQCWMQILVENGIYHPQDPDDLLGFDDKKRIKDKERLRWAWTCNTLLALQDANQHEWWEQYYRAGVQFLAAPGHEAMLVFLAGFFAATSMPPLPPMAERAVDRVKGVWLSLELNHPPPVLQYDGKTPYAQWALENASKFRKEFKVVYDGETVLPAGKRLAIKLPPELLFKSDSKTGKAWARTQDGIDAKIQDYLEAGDEFRACCLFSILKRNNGEIAGDAHVTHGTDAANCLFPQRHAGFHRVPDTIRSDGSAFSTNPGRAAMLYMLQVRKGGSIALNTAGTEFAASRDIQHNTHLTLDAEEIYDGMKQFDEALKKLAAAASK